METNLNLKINGAGPTGLLLAIALAKLGHNIYITDLLTKEKLLSKDKTYAITHSTQKILVRFNLWEKIESKIYGFNSLSISDSIISSQSLFFTSDLNNDLRNLDNIGWVVKHSELIKLLFDETDYFKNISFDVVNNQKVSKNNFDYEFIANGANSHYRNVYKAPFYRKSYNQSCLTFKLIIRGNIEKRAYEIFREEGPLALLPLNKNIYQVIWTCSNQASKERINLNQNLLLDNLSTILPSNFKLDQIIGDINIFPVSLSFILPPINLNKKIFVGDALHTFHPVGGQGLNSCWRDVNEIYNLFKTEKTIKHIRNKYYIRRFSDVFSLILVTDSLISTFANKSLLLIPIRKLSFFALNKFRFLRRMLINYMTKSICYNSINFD